jgi:Family of unknown function (DUF6644)
MSQALFHLCEQIEATSLGVLVRESIWGFPILVTVHIITLVFSVGIVVWLDLRLLGVSMTSVPVSRVYRRLMPLALVGFAIMLASGATIFTGFATSAYKNPYFRVKLIALLLAGINAFAYHTNIERRISLWDRSPVPPTAARMAGIISIAAWTTVILAGRMMSYTLYTR